jgi:class 3 adenylate cyclase/tetratricopeptide (TPR) repeat protein
VHRTLEYLPAVLDASEVICTSCGRENPAASRFCGACGAPLPAESLPDVRKTVTVVFCDLVGSTALGERADPEVLRELMTRYHAELRGILERHGGTVEKFVGDAAMAIFGLPHVHEDDALRAVRAAVEMRDAVAPLGLEVRIGVNTGEVVAGTGETLATGDAVNVAARLEQAAEVGEVLIGSATERLVRDAVRTEAVEPLALKGKSEAVPASRVLELLDDVPAYTHMIDAPFVGREAEIERLERALASAVEARSPQLVTIAGPPGIGKSRLARELLGRAVARVVVGRCLSYGEGITYWPLSEIVSQLGDVEAALDGSIDADLAATRIGAGLGSVETRASPEEIAWAFRKLFEALAAKMPLIVVFDDIHWAEPTLLDLIEYVAAFAQDVPLFVLCTTRPDLFEQRPTWTAPKPNATLLTLGPLADSDSESLVTRLGDVPAATRQRIVEVAEGNPLFVEQLVAMQAESGNGELDVPPTLQALLAARIDRLTKPERAVVERGSVEGRQFHRGAVAALLPELDRAKLGTHLLTLVRKELIRPDRSTLPGDDGFRFSHILIRDAAYEAIPKRQRAALHERYAEWLVSRLGHDALDEIIGYHLEQAYRYGAELGEADPTVGVRAAERLSAAAHAARARQDVAAAVNLFGRAVELIPGEAPRCLIWVHLGEALKEADELTRARAALEEGVGLARKAGDGHAEWLGRVLLAHVGVLQDPEATERLLEVCKSAIAAREAAEDHEVLASAWARIASAHNWRGERSEYLQALELALYHARQAGSLALEVTLMGMRAPDFIWGPGVVEEGLQYADEIDERLGHVPGVQQFALHLRGHMQARLGEFDAALEAMNEYRRHLRELGKEREYANSGECVWDVCLWSGSWQYGEAAMREAYELMEQRGNKAYLSTAAINLGEAVVRQGRLEEAERLCEVGDELRASDDAEAEARLSALRARVRAARGDLVRAEVHARRALELAAGTDYLEQAADAWLILAEILRAKGDADEQSAAAQALRLYEQKGNVVGARRVRAFIEKHA